MLSNACMGALNRACFAASSGRHVVLMNDDVILRTKNWEIAVAAAFARFVLCRVAGLDTPRDAITVLP